MIYNNYCIVSDMNIIRFCIWLSSVSHFEESTKLKSTINTSQRINPHFNKRFLGPNLIQFNSPDQDLANGVQYDGFPDIKLRPARIAA